jgi:hypothetical protein
MQDAIRAVHTAAMAEMSHTGKLFYLQAQLDTLEPPMLWGTREILEELLEEVLNG